MKITANLEAFGEEIPITFEKKSKNKIRITLPADIADIDKPKEKRFIDLRLHKWIGKDVKFIALSIEDNDSEFAYEVKELN